MILCTLLVFGLGFSGASAEDTADPLEIAILPYLSTRTVLSIYSPLQRYLEHRLRRPVLLVTAPTMRIFVDRTQSGVYDYLVSAPHFARYAQLEAGYQPFLAVDRKLYGTLVISKDSDIPSVSALRGKVVSTPDRLAIVSMLGHDLMRRHGLQPGRDVEMLATPSHNSAVLSVRRGAAAAAVTSISALRQMPRALRGSVKELASTAHVPHLMYLANLRIPAGEVEEMTEVLLEFAEKTPEGKAFIANMDYDGLHKPSAAEMGQLDPYVQDLKKLLKTQ